MSDVFHELSRSLGDEERKALLKRISDSLNYRTDAEDNIYHKDPNREERKKLIEKEVAALNWLQRFFLWMRMTFSGKPLNQVVSENKLRSIQRRVNRKVPGFAGFDTQVLYPAFALKVFELFKAVLPLREPFKRFWSEGEHFQAILAAVIEERLGEPRQKVEDLITTDEMVEIYSRKGTRAAVRSEFISRLQSYTDTLGDDIFHNLEEEILPVYYIKELVSFPFHSFFEMFHYVPPRDPGESAPFFKTASANLSLDLIERLYYAVYIISKADDKGELNVNLLRRLFSNEDQDDVYSEEQIIQGIKDVIKLGKSFYNDVPLADIIRFFRKDPYYQLIFYMPTMNLKDFYLSILKIRLLSDLDEVFDKVRDTYIERETAKFFKEKRYFNFPYYRVYMSIDYKAADLPFFIHTRSVSLVYNYLKIFYREYMQEIVRILERNVLDQNRITRDLLLSHAANLEDLEDKIKQFDYSLSPDSEDGKLFQRLRFSLAGDPSHQRMYRTLVVQKDREVKTLLDRSHESLEGLSKIFQELILTRSDSIRIQLKSHFLLNGKSTSLESALKHWTRHINDFLILFNQVLRIEKGRSS
ncbi:hypothetical protein B4O97_16610 [Marispirochaeta aestuarii]|uniref:Uncharacterized protein n=2 Tax=Marispirochaeta aestuarii TaxID=1963862 RepID=A0A1Y1RUA4_9SPIO|nr:DUF5312 family protein [Marispirochaeta aestuarii]ORC31884.1 hypothetical protein B4O97_16610 [Marispirochaeta aestuarii]